jgi:hypothetical protein
VGQRTYQQLIVFLDNHSWYPHGTDSGIPHILQLVAAEWHGWNLKTLHNHRFRCFFALFPGGKPPILLYHENRLLLTLMFSHHVFHSNAGRRLHGCPCSQTHAHIIHIIHIIYSIYLLYIYYNIYICVMSIMLIVCLMIIYPIGLPLFIGWIPIDGEHIQFLDYHQFLSKTYIYITHIMYHIWRLSLCFHIYIMSVYMENSPFSDRQPSHISWMATL